MSTRSLMKCGRQISYSLVMLFVVTGCGKKTMAPPPPPSETIVGYSEPGGLQESLFKGDQAVLSDQDIARILSTQVKLTDRHHLAILNLNSINPWSEDLADIETKNFANLVGALKSSPQLTEVRLLPSMLVPEKRTVPYLREAAARIQADLLFVYTSRIESFRRDRFLKPNEVHALCVAESVLLDVRTGIVVHTGRATENIAIQKTSADLNFSETIARAQSEARGKALLSLAGLLTERLAKETN